MTAQELIQRTGETNALSLLWASTIGPAPEPAQFYHWLNCFGFDTTVAAIQRTAQKFALLNGTMDTNYQRKYCTSVAKNRHAQGGAQCLAK
jgi:hypothetical protein